jgi:formamidase
VGLMPPGGWRPVFPAYEAPPRPPRPMFATTGIPLDDAGDQGDLDLNLATRRALLELLDWLTATRGLEREAAYVLMSVAAELRVSELVDAPNALVSAALPLDVFEA